MKPFVIVCVGSRLLESGADPHDVREFLGHANISTTSRYLASTPLRLEKALARMEAANAEPAEPTTTTATTAADEKQTGERVN